MQNKRLIAALAYIPIIGWLVVWGTQYKADEFVARHAKQSVSLVALAVLTPLLWLVFAWLVAFVPYIGPVIAAGSFAMVIAIYVYLLLIWLIGIMLALQDKYVALPFVTPVKKRIFGNASER